MSALTKADLVETLCGEVRLSKHDAKALTEDFFEEIKISLEAGSSVKLSGFGNFEVRSKNARPGRNPRTLQPTIITARRVATFRAGQKLRAQVEQSAALKHADSTQRIDDES